MHTKLAIAAAFTALLATGVLADDKATGHGQMMNDGKMGGDQMMDHGQMDHGQMNHGAMSDEASGVGVINTVDADKGTINITHEPMPELGWPTMTMDLPVTRRVDLSIVKAGEKVDFKVKLGRDKQYRVTDISPAK